MSTPTPPEERPATPAPAPERRRGPGRGLTVLAGIAASGALAGASRATWVQASAPDLTGTAQQVAVPGADAAPAVLALALVALAASLATSLSSSWLRLLTAPILVLAGAGAAVAALGVLRAPGSSTGSAVTSATGVAGGAVTAETTWWPAAAALLAVLVAAVGMVVLLRGGRWPRRTRYRSAAVRTAADPAEDPSAAWDALTRGEDPSLEGTEPPHGPQEDGEAEGGPGAR
ncbi:Trp biosynthesis-associated membrane protein [Brachybacterium saurashtrense]|uniref:Trp biosynthesis protein n=1 Tax=Brachybacterium saurashtrense TaxID=556288 RepID=A0A345YM65_9MICO|nr:Trp biosynthesis-associated membrane protein [Brachybacterium saurashtrense]AXK45017.1 hypothetical protein DWV08_04915 [Brachybacterium saurashtrense]RRR21701.1 hypothetical protein DXU92_13490 [Brachybacterium saurashtrense]